MSKQMTPCEKLGYKVGDKFKVVDGTGVHYAVGSFITLIHDDGSSCPRFNGVHSIFESGDSFFPLDFVEKVAKLKPAKQALADAIHQNGGWPESELLDFATSNAFGEVLCSASHPERNGNVWVNGDSWRLIASIKGTIANWHQTVLSRDEYFTAYPEQVKVEVNNETKHQVEVEMKSESEMKIKIEGSGVVAVRDWHKNGDLPPVGVFVDVVGKDLVYGQDELNCEVIAHVENTAVIRMSYGLGCFESSAITPARTEREKAIDEMQRIIEESDKHGPLDQLGSLYDAGYRKEVK